MIQYVTPDFIFSRIGEGVAVYKAVEEGNDFVFVWVNQTVERMEQVSRDILIGKRVTEVFPGVTDMGLLGVFRRVYRTGVDEALPMARYRDGRIEGWRENRVYKSPEGGIVAIYRDVLKDHDAAEKEAFLAKFPAENPNPVFRISREGEILYANPPSTPVLRDMTAPNAINRLSPDWHRKMGKIFLSEKPAQEEIGVGTFTYLLHIVPILECGYINVYGIDITQKKRLETFLAQNQKMEAVGRLAGGMSHEFNNFLTVILGYTQLFPQYQPMNEKGQEFLEEITSASHHASNMVKDLLAFSKDRSIEYAPLLVDDEVRASFRLLRNVLPENIRLELFLGAEPHTVRGNRTQLQQMLLNLISNAKDAMPLGGRLQIETKKARLSPDQARAYGGLDPGEYIQLFVSDTGVGMDQATQTRIFDPFFTTKPKDKGTGLGLSIVYGIVKQMKGAVSVYSEPGHGTQFKIHFPTSPEGLTRPTAQTESKETTPVLDLRRAIVVEDDKSVRTFLHNILQGLKLEVIEAATAAEAEAAIPPFFGERVLMICDVVLPDQNGRQLAETLKGRGYLLEIIFISGYTENVVFHDHALDPGVHFLNKPFAPADLIAKIRQICDKG